MVGVVVLIAIVAGVIVYGQWLTRAIKPRTFTTTLAPNEVRALFEAKVARAGWKVVDDGNPLIAQSSLATGIRQQIALQTSPNGTGTKVVVGAQRWVRKWYGVPTKAHTIRLRLNSFVAAVRAQDPALSVQLAG